MSTKTVRRPNRKTTNKETTKLPEWRRICHYYDDESRVSVCGTAMRRAGRGHKVEYCKSRRHSICIVCLSILESQGRMP